ncbi:MAG: ECF transporter S component [Candidatus Bathyarchaeia archaeon]
MGVFMNREPGPPSSLKAVSTALCAALYAIGSYATSYIQSPWGMGQFRPAVVIPALFATIFGPWVGGIGAAIGTLICDSVKHGGLYMGSLLAAVPGNFIGFFLFGHIVRRGFSWRRFIAASNASLAIGNLIVAFLYVFAYKALYAQALPISMEALTLLSIGLTIFWFITMLPFVLLIAPPIIRAVAISFPSIVPEGMRAHSLRGEIPRREFGLALAIPGIAMLLMGFSTSTAFGRYLATNFSKTFTPMIMELLQIMLYGSGIALSALGFAVLGAVPIGRRREKSFKAPS